MRENQQLSSQTWCNTKLISPLMKLTHFACSWWVCIHQWCTEARTYILMNPDTEESPRSFNVVYTCTRSSFWPADSCFAFLPTFSLIQSVLYWWPSSAQLPVCWLWPYSEPKMKKEGYIHTGAYTRCLMNVCIVTVMILKYKSIILCVWGVGVFVSVRDLHR